MAANDPLKPMAESAKLAETEILAEFESTGTEGTADLLFKTEAKTEVVSLDRSKPWSNEKKN